MQKKSINSKDIYDKLTLQKGFWKTQKVKNRQKDRRKDYEMV